MKAKFKCLGCRHEYEDKPGPTTCPKCGHIYVKWVNYEEWRKCNPIMGARKRKMRTSYPTMQGRERPLTNSGGAEKVSVKPQIKGGQQGEALKIEHGSTFLIKRR